MIQESTGELTRHPGTTEAFTLRLNHAAGRDLPWTAAQDAILSDVGLRTARL